MKKFEDLTREQREKAKAFFYSEIKTSIQMGFLSFDKKIDDLKIKTYAYWAADEAIYSDEGEVMEETYELGT